MGTEILQEWELSRKFVPKHALCTLPHPTQSSHLWWCRPGCPTYLSTELATPPYSRKTYKKTHRHKIAF